MKEKKEMRRCGGKGRLGGGCELEKGVLCSLCGFIAHVQVMSNGKLRKFKFYAALRALRITRNKRRTCFIITCTCRPMEKLLNFEAPLDIVLLDAVVGAFYSSDKTQVFSSFS
jgi:hypothetical protein